MWENSKQPDPAGGPNTGGQLWSLLIAFNTRQRRGAREGRVRISRSGKGGKALDPMAMAPDYEQQGLIYLV